jgi:hypothetical protein
MFEGAAPSRRLAHAFAVLAVVLAQQAESSGAPMLNLTQLPGDPGDMDEINAPTPLVTDTTTHEAVLPFRLSADFRCTVENGRPQLFITLTDTTRLFDLKKRSSPQTVEIMVPLAQMPWLDGRENCAGKGNEKPNYTDADGLPYFRLRSRATVFGTLICTGPGKSQMLETSTIPLDVWLRCPLEPIAPAEPADLANLKEHLDD